MCMWGAAWPSRGHVGAGGPGEGSPLPGLSPEPPFQRSVFWRSGLALARMDLSPARCLGASACTRPTPQASTGFPGLTQLAQHPSPDPSTGCDSSILLAAQADGPGSSLARPSSSCPLLRTSPPCALRLVCSTGPWVSQSGSHGPPVAGSVTSHTLTWGRHCCSRCPRPLPRLRPSARLHSVWPRDCPVTVPPFYPVLP